jgi:hypothetical protein
MKTEKKLSIAQFMAQCADAKMSPDAALLEFQRRFAPSVISRAGGKEAFQHRYSEALAARNLVLASSIKSMWRPRRKVCAVQCNDCPFRPDGGRLAGKENVKEREQVLRSARMGIEFHCHKFVWTGIDTETPTQRHPDHWQVCLGMADAKRSHEVESRKQMFRDEGRLIEDEK